ncbi:XRE family transcriptional regulator [Mesorhizobium sp. M2C.T.Ca.TU.002.02.1.1]|uniref:helix-turn-helix domain-containing protein n=1 Tax=Mesorhizobium sp. M2C.T.Ca.TU.002.02.1.1 TaxID=2496788 RepID=UPI000FCA6BD1|nr:XRE family transcriptional regulator [Mesorhizobium sp. M2C.T.Ca.TU.002.02.1.1]RUU61051.1 helix-turn-helix domain-containing protein [Mesorhizobium sp. M2C.T.Ca.TU.002.02.1.1]RUU71956.1 helix-turn-helix domain-containing protein [Mesorhizobium sp. M2C.T.Ca.TU.009.01.2.1]
MTTTIGTRIKALREQRKLSQDELSRAFGFKDRQTLSAIETGERKVAADELLRAAEILGVRMDYFTDPFLLAGDGQFSWRQTGVDGDKLRGYEEAAGRFIAAFRTLGRQVGHKPPLIRPTLSLTRQSSYDDAIAAGERFAAEFGLGDVPARRLAEIMAEKLGILVLMVDPIEGVSGAACQLPELDVVLINRNEVAGRRHFDLAHELFHIMTWKEMPPEHIEEAMPVKRSRVEQLADNFASALLMPSAVLDRFGDWAQLTEAALTDRLNEVADELLVTSQALRWRLFGMGRLSREQNMAISDDTLRNNGRNKPGKQTPPPLFSKPFVRIVATALDEGKTSMRRIASILGLAIDDFGELFAAHGVEAPYEL